MKTKALMLAAVALALFALALSADARPRRTGTISTVDGASYGPHFENFNVLGCVSCHGTPVIHLLGEDHVAGADWVSQDSPGPATTFSNNGVVPHSAISGSYPKGFGPAHVGMGGWTGGAGGNRLTLGAGADILDLNPPFTVCAVVTDPPTAGNRVIISDGYFDGAFKNGWMLWRTGGTWQFSVGTDTPTAASQGCVGSANVAGRAFSVCAGIDAANKAWCALSGQTVGGPSAVLSYNPSGALPAIIGNDNSFGNSMLDGNIYEIYVTTTAPTSTSLTTFNNQALGCATPGSCYIEEAGMVEHCTTDTDWSGGLKCRRNAGSVWTTNGAVTLSSARYNWPYQTTKIDREGAGPFTDVNFLSSLHGPPNVWDFAGDFTCRAIFDTPTNLAVAPDIFSAHSNPATSGYLAYLSTTGQGAFQDCDAGGCGAATATANVTSLGMLNVMSFGRNGANRYIKLNNGVTATAAARIRRNTTELSYIGRDVVAGAPFAGVIYELQCTTAAFVEAIETVIHQRFFGMLTNLGYTPISVTNSTVRSQVADGRLTYAPPNTLRHGWGTSDYSNVGVGSIYEGQTINTDTYCEQLDHAGPPGWVATNTTVTADQGVFADGQTSMELVNTTVVGGRILYAATTASSATFVHSAWFRSDAGSKVGTTGVFCGGALTVTACTCYRDDGGTCTADGTLDANQSCIAYGTFDTTKPVRMAAFATCSAATTTPSHFFSGGRYATTAAQLYIGGAQLETGTALSTYCGPTLALAKTCNADVVTMSNPLRPPGTDIVNLAQNNEQLDTWALTNTTAVANVALSPDGSISADRLTSTVNGGFAQSANVTSAASTYTGSVQAKISAAAQAFDIVVWDSTAGSAACTGTATTTSSWATASCTTAALAAGHTIVLRVYPGRTTGTGAILATDARLGIGTSVLSPCGPTLAASLTCGPGGAIGKTRTNVAQWNQQLDHTAGGIWSRTRLNTVTPDAIAGPTSIPVGAGDLLIEDGSAATTHSLGQTYTATAVAWTMSVYAKQKERSWFALTPDNLHSAYFNSATCAVGTIAGAGTTAACDAVDSGWCRCRVSATLAAGATTAIIYMANADNSASYNGDNASGIYLTGVQLETGLEATPPCGETFAGARTCSPPQKWCVRVKNATPSNGRAWGTTAISAALVGGGTYANANSFMLYDSAGVFNYAIANGYGTPTAATRVAVAGTDTVIGCAVDGIQTVYVNGVSTTSASTGGLFTAWPLIVSYGGNGGTYPLYGSMEAVDFCNAGTPQECGWL